MVNLTIIDVATCVGSDVLLGRPMGNSHFPKLLAKILALEPDSIACLDFKGITNITASYIAATIVRLLRMIAAETLDRNIILTGVHPDYEGEIGYVLETEGTPALYWNGRDLSVIGPLDDAYATTYAAVKQRGRVTARELHDVSAENIGQTGWIKRLTTLYALGLIRRKKIGREFAYESMNLEASHG
jgi:hypothetical protein